MKTFVKCKACGFIMDENHLKDLCPACGLPKTVFEPYTKKISPKRKFIIDQHLHPVSVHFPQVFIVVIMFLLPLTFWIDGPLREEFLAAVKLSILALPLSVLLGFITGLIDGKIRFKKLTTPLLINKAIAGVILQILSIAIFALYLMNGFTPTNMIIITVLSVLSAACGIYLGRVGSTMFDSIMPG
ncbi:rubredoxin-like domain-containing protein [Pelosinus sp. sgz500959]|uniref:rubredoxin-like domain-containing protein n=1 Tax=Pelosinus sp. sgz500959 TaxID=3242472 RepID=UPI00366F4E8F